MLVVENASYKYSKLTNNTAINGNEVSWTFWEYVCMTYNLVLVQELPYKYSTLPNSNVINGKDASI